jgi:hypothetical protein
VELFASGGTMSFFSDLLGFYIGIVYLTPSCWFKVLIIVYFVVVVIVLVIGGFELRVLGLLGGLSTT